MTETEIDYEGLAQSALRGVVRAVLARVAESDKLPGNHHFYISFDTNGEGVSVSKRLREQYPEEMTIVLQHRYWDLQVHDDRFEVKLTFNSIPERLVVPFSSIKVFFDPSVPYGLQFESAGAVLADKLPKADGTSARQRTQKPGSPRRARPTAVKSGSGTPVLHAPTAPVPALLTPAVTPAAAKLTAVKPGAGAEAEPPHAAASPSAEPVKPAEPLALPSASAASAAPAAPSSVTANSAETSTEKPAGQVVRLDAFRKK